MNENFLNRIPLKIYRELRWCHGTHKEYLHIRSYFSKEYAQICLDAVTTEHKGKSTNDILSAYAKKDDYIIRYLMDLCGDVIEKYKTGEYLLSKQNTQTIWVFWWTGEDSAPDIVKSCIRSIRRNANGHNVIMIDKSNYDKYVTLPEYILNKHGDGIISHAHFSDIVRLTLLSTYGGVWIDATVFLSQPLPNMLFETSFYTLKSYDSSAPYYSKSRWCGYFLAGSSDFLLFSFARDLLFAHWERTDHIIDYLLMDYTFGIACNTFPEVRDSFDRIPDNNILRGNLMRHINEPYSPELFRQLSNQDTFASKLSWRYGKPKALTSDGKLSNYGYLLNL